MKVALSGKLDIISRDEQDLTVTLQARLKGEVADTPSPSCKIAHGTIVISLKPLVVEQLAFGSTLYVTITDKKPDDAGT